MANNVNVLPNSGHQPPPANLDVEFISLPHKSSARLATRWISSPSGGEISVLIVFLNGMMSTVPSWNTAIDQFSAALPANHKIALLCYDRYGQGQSEKDPNDSSATDPSHAHNLVSSATDLYHLIEKYAPSKETKVVLVGNSIGCALSRVYVEHHPDRAPAGLLFLDTILANTNMLHLFPDPDAEGFKADSLAEGVTEPNLRKTRAFMAKVFDPVNGSAEGLTRRDLATLLPKADGPTLPGNPYLTVVGHGAERFVAESAAVGMDGPSIMAYLQPFWAKHIADLLQIVTDEKRRRGPVEAIGAGHFVQRDRPDLVAEELRMLLDKVGF